MTRWLAPVALAALLGAGCPAASVSDCAVHCVTGGECPDGLSCGAEGYCRVSNVELTCAALLDGGGGGGDGDGGGGTGSTDAAPCLTPGGCDIVAGRPSPVLEL